MEVFKDSTSKKDLASLSKNGTTEMIFGLKILGKAVKTLHV
jgi:hypothetical protein